MSLPNRPKISDQETDKIANYFFSNNIPPVVVFFIRGYFENSIGIPGKNDFGVYDDAALVYIGGQLVKTFNANTDPQKLRSDLAMLNPGVYQFAQGMHKNRIKAFRAYPEGVRLECQRQDKKGVWYKSYCQAINCHDGGASDTWSAGCLTLPNYSGEKQFDEFRSLVNGAMDRAKLKTVTFVLLEVATMKQILAMKG